MYFPFFEEGSSTVPLVSVVPFWMFCKMRLSSGFGGLTESREDAGSGVPEVAGLLALGGEVSLVDMMIRKVHEESWEVLLRWAQNLSELKSVH